VGGCVGTRPPAYFIFTSYLQQATINEKMGLCKGNRILFLKSVQV